MLTLDFTYKTIFNLTTYISYLANYQKINKYIYMFLVARRKDKDKIDIFILAFLDSLRYMKLK